MDDDLDLADLFDCSADLRHRAALHEAGHAAFSWAVGGWTDDAPPFEFLEIEEEPNEFGIIPGSFQPAATWFASLSDVKRAVVMLGGWFAQEGQDHPAEDGAALRSCLIDKLNDNSDCTDDIGKVLELEPLGDDDAAAFWQHVHLLLDDLQSSALPAAAALADRLEERKRLSWDDAREVFAS